MEKERTTIVLVELLIPCYARANGTLVDMLLFQACLSPCIWIAECVTFNFFFLFWS